MKTRRFLIAALLMIATFISCSKSEVIDPKSESSPEQTSKSTEMISVSIYIENGSQIKGLTINGNIIDEYTSFDMPKNGTITIIADADYSNQEYNKFYLYNGDNDIVSRLLEKSYLDYNNGQVIEFKVTNHMILLVSNVIRTKPYDVWITADPDIWNMTSGSNNHLTMVPTRFNPDMEGKLYFEIISETEDWYIYKKNADNTFTYHSTLLHGYYGYYDNYSEFKTGGNYHLTNNPNLDPKNPQ